MGLGSWATLSIYPLMAAYNSHVSRYITTWKKLVSIFFHFNNDYNIFQKLQVYTKKYVQNSHVPVQKPTWFFSQVHIDKCSKQDENTKTVSIEDIGRVYYLRPSLPPCG